MGLTRTPIQPPPKFTHSTESIASDTEDLITSARAHFDRIAKLTPETTTFKSVLLEIAKNENHRIGQNNILTFYQHVSTDKNLRDASSAAEEKLNEFEIELGMREDIFKRVEQVYGAKPSDLSSEESRLLEKVHRDFVRNGLALESDKRTELKKLQVELSNLSIQFSKRLGEEKGGVWFTKEELVGVPSDVSDNFEEKEGKLKMSFKYPDLFPTLKFAKNGETRKRAFIGDQNKEAARENVPILERAVEVRHKIADLLGYQTWAHYVLEERMAKTPKRVNGFLLDLKEKFLPGGRKEAAALKELKKEDLAKRKVSNEPAEVMLWDTRYLDRLMQEEMHNIDQQKVSEYFPLQATYTNMLEIFSRLFGLKFEEVLPEDSARSVWHDDCQQFAVWSTDKDEFVGWLYFDLFPREGKYGHAANFGITPGYIDEERTYPVTALVCNFTKPSKTKPSLLKHDEVVTFFHELGHGIHDLIAQVRFARFHGTNVARDFVEAPSQMLENWCFVEDELQFLSSHYERPQEKIPLDLVKRIIETKHLNDFLFNLRQLHFALFDLRIHSSGIPAKGAITEWWNDMRRELSLVKDDGDVTYGHGSFGHMFGYDSV